VDQARGKGGGRGVQCIPVGPVRLDVVLHSLAPWWGIRGYRTHDLSGRAAVDLRLRPCGHWDRHNGKTYNRKIEHKVYNTQVLS